MSKRWYVVHAYSGFEKSVQRALEDRVRRAGMQEKFGKILVPTEEVVEMKGGQKNISERKFFPGYVLVEMEMNDETWHLVKSTSKVTGFVGGTASKPTPISVKEVANIMHQMQEGVEKPKPKVLFAVGEGVRVKEGPFADFHGMVEDVNYDKSKLRVSVTKTLAFSEPSERRSEQRNIDLSISSPAINPCTSENVSQNETGAGIVWNDETCAYAIFAAGRKCSS